MGKLFRRYWIPFLVVGRSRGARRRAGPGQAAVREPLIAFRDSDGKLGLIEEFCAHRRVSLWFGRNEEGGLRCPVSWLEIRRSLVSVWKCPPNRQRAAIANR